MKNDEVAAEGAVAFGQRLEREVRAWRGIRAFHKAMHARKVRGSSLPAIYSYIRGDTSPRPEFLRAAAEVLGVNREWLESGRGVREAGAAGAGSTERGPSWADTWAAGVRGVQETFPKYEYLSYAARSELANAVHAQARTLYYDKQAEAGGCRTDRAAEHAYSSDHDPDLYFRAGILVGKAIAAPLELLSIRPTEIPLSDFNDYVMNLATALGALVTREAEEQFDFLHNPDRSDERVALVLETMKERGEL